MIELQAPGATVLQTVTFFTGKGLNACFWLATFSPAMLPGVVIKLDEPDENWVALRATISELAVVIGARIRVVLADPDPSKLKGRPGVRSFWVDGTGVQTEV